MKEPIRVGALISGGGTNLQAVIDACEKGTIPAEVAFVGTDNPGAKGLERAQKHGIPSFVVDYAGIFESYRENPESCVLPRDCDLDDILARQRLLPLDCEKQKADDFFIRRIRAEADLLEQMEGSPHDLLILAGFMRVVTPYFIDRVNKEGDLPRLMNIHPALLPSFPGTDGYGDTFRHGCRVGGCTVHFVDYGEDTGPIIGQRCFAIEPDDNLDSVRKKGLEQEWLLYPECIRLFAQGRLSLAETEDPGGKTRRIVRIRTD